MASVLGLCAEIAQQQQSGQSIAQQLLPTSPTWRPATQCTRLRPALPNIALMPNCRRWDAFFKACKGCRVDFMGESCGRCWAVTSMPCVARK